MKPSPSVIPVLSFLFILLLLPSYISTLHFSDFTSTHFNLSLPRTALASAFLPPALLFFAGGLTSSGSPSSAVDIFNTRLHQHYSGMFLNVARSNLAAAAISFPNGTSGGSRAIATFAKTNIVT